MCADWIGPAFPPPQPGAVIAVTVEDDALVGSDGVADQSVDGGIRSSRTLQTIRELPEGVRHGAVEHDVDTGDGVGGAQHPELKLVACEGEGGRAVAVRGVPKEPGQRGYAQLHPGALCALIGLLRLNGFEHRRQLVAQEDRDHGGWSLIGAQPVIVPGGGNRCAQKVLVVIHGLNHRAQKQQELGIFVRCLAGGRAGSRRRPWPGTSCCACRSR